MWVVQVADAQQTSRHQMHLRLGLGLGQGLERLSLVVVLVIGGVVARWARAGHLFLTISHPCLFLPPHPLTKQPGVPSRSV